jgi:NAD(P)-dependent dehydrogenase (short-subunit alcohol dehydrogenase family)
MPEWTGKVAVVTGAAGAIGRALAVQFAELGMNVVIADIDAAALETTEEELLGQRATVLTVPTDIRKPADVQALADQTRATFGNVHVLCANAGVLGRFTYLWEQQPADWEWEFGVNVFGTANTIRAFLPDMIASGEASHVVITSSEAGYSTPPFVGVYHATKHALVAVAETLAREVQMVKSRVRVHMLCPVAVIAPRLLDPNRQQLRPPELHTADAPALPEGERLWELYRTSIATKQTGDQVARAVIEGIEADRFYIFPDARMTEIVRRKYEATLAGQYPELDPAFVERVSNPATAPA